VKAVAGLRRLLEGSDALSVAAAAEIPEALFRAFAGWLPIRR
jgi:hypothetical protein